MATLNDLTKKPLERAEVIHSSVLSINAVISSSDTLALGSVVITTDEGATFKACPATLPTDPYRLGILGDYAGNGEVANVVLIGVAKQVGTIAEAVKTALFNSNIIIKE